MKRFLAIAIVAFCMANTAHADFSEGYRMGMLDKYSISGMMNKSGEGFLNMGREGAPVIEKDKKGHKTYLNPWAFSSTDAGKYSQAFMNQFAGEYVVIKYRQDFYNSGFSQKTPYNITSIEKVNPAVNKPLACEDKSSGGGAKSDGFRTGRIVKVSTKGAFNKSFEVTIQIGNSGGLYFPMSALSKEMYDCAIQNLKSAKQMKLFYAKSWTTWGTSDTNYSIWKIEPIGDI
jgi:hypothetical protein